MTLEHESSVSMFPWRLLHVVNRGMKSGIILPSSQLRDFVSAALVQECLLLEHRTQRRISELRSVCSQFFPNLGFAVLGTFSYFAKGLVTAQQQSLQRTWVAYALNIMFVRSHWTCISCMSVVLWKNGKCENVNAWSSTVDRRWWARERGQEVAHFCGWLGDGAAADLAIEGGWPLPTVSCLRVLAKAVRTVSRSLK